MSTTEGTPLKKYMAMLRHGREQVENVSSLAEVRLAVLADHAPQQLTVLLKSAIKTTGLFPVIYEADYATAAFEVYDDASDLFAFAPEWALLSISVQKYRDRFLSLRSMSAREELPEAYLAELLAIIDKLGDAGIKVIVSNFALPIERMLGSFSVLTTQSLYGSVIKFNSLLAEAIVRRSFCAINDVMYLAARIGAERFFDERLWLSAKYLCSNQALPDIAHSVSRALAVRRGKVSKVLVLDLDNTLWGGVIGDDGLDGIQLGGDAIGEAFRLFQQYLLGLKQRGYVLAVCSKNNEEFALEVFQKHPEMVLREEDIAVFVANWNDKASNIDYISRVLNLGLDSFVFIDDSEFERDLVRQALPSILIPTLSEDPSGYIAAIEDSGVLEASTVSPEDGNRNQSYREEAKRTTAQLQYGSIDDYLMSLDMEADCQKFRPDDLPRISQLLQRSNQFNLRTQRLSEAECEAYMVDTERRVGLQIKLADKFGDYGLISVICCDVDQDVLSVTELVMSCRVLKRGVEGFIINRLFKECRDRGLTGIRGEYRFSSKNAMVRQFYSDFGFTMVDADATKEIWFLPASVYIDRQVYIKEKQND